jgi:hypothetical protein
MEDLKEMNGWSLERKILVSLTRIMEFQMRMKNKTYVYKKRSLEDRVLLSLVLRACPDVHIVDDDYYEELAILYENKPFLPLIASRSDEEREDWLMYGCNIFQGMHTSSRPISFWTQDDLKKYAEIVGIEIERRSE